MAVRSPRLRRVLLARLVLALLIVVALAAAKLLWSGGAEHVYGGIPRATDWSLRLTTHTITNPGFALGYSELRGTPLWVGYVARDPAGGRSLPRPGRFRTDPRTLRRVGHDDYTGSGFDRGHLAPNYLISRVYGERAQARTFRMSNIVPQTRRLNQLLWQRMEELEADVLAPRHDRLWVLTGPVFADRPEHLPGRIAVPEAFYRIWLREDGDGTPQAVAFLVPQEVCGDETLGDYLVRVDDIEVRTGLDFFRALRDTHEARLSQRIALEQWPGVKNARSPARYAGRFAGEACPYR